MSESTAQSQDHKPTQALPGSPARGASGPDVRRSGTSAHLLALVILISLQLGLAAWFMTGRAPGTDAAWVGLPLDDAWIHLVYARSIAQHGLPYYNEGELESGFTSPLWAVACAGAVIISAATGISVALAVKGLGVVGGIALTLGVYALTRALVGGVAGPLLAGGLTALTPGLAFAQVSGMEVSLAAALSIWAMYFMQRGRTAWAGLLLGLAVITRPELILLVVCVAFVTGSYFPSDSTPKRFKQLGWVMGPTALLVGLWAAYCWSVTGSPLPNTFHAKFNPLQQDHSTVERVIEMLKWMPLPLAGAGLALWLAAAGLIRRWRSPAAIVVLAAPWLLLAGLALTRDFPAGSAGYFYWLRYILPVVPLLLAPVGVSYELLRRAHVDNRRRAAGSRLLSGAGLVVLPLPMLFFVPQLIQARSVYAWNCQNIEEVQVALGRWIAANTPKDAAVVVNDAGAIRYFGDRRTIDLLGLNHYPLAQNRGRLFEILGSAANLRAFMVEHEADYLAVFPDHPLFQAVTSPDGRRTFMRLHEARSAHYTLAPTDTQSVKAVFQRIR